MALHPGERKRHFPEEAPVAWDPIRRDLEENEDWYRDLVEHSQDLLCVHDLEGRFLSVNPVPARLLGYSVEELLRTPMREFIDPQFRKQFDEYLREIERTGVAHGLLALITRSGERRIWEYHSTLRTEGVPTPIVRSIAHDVTDRARAEQALRRTNEQLLATAREREQVLRELTLFRTLLDRSNDAILVTDPETLRFLDSNERAWAELGYSREELLSMTVFDIDPDIVSVQTRVDQQLRQTGCAIIERAHRRKDGTTFPVELNLHRVRLDREYDVAVSRDISERKQAQEALRRSEESYRMFVAQSSEGIFRQDLDAPIPVDLPEDDLVHHILHDSYMAECNDAFVKMYGLNSKQDFLGKRLTETLDPNDPNNIQLTRDFVRSGFRVQERESHEVDMQGNPKIFLNSMIGIVEDGNLVRTWGIQRDVTEKVKLEEERKRAEEALRESAARERARAKELETVLDAVPVAVCIAHDKECQRMTGNRAAHEQLRVPAGQNFSKSALLGQRPTFRLVDDGAEIPTDLLPMQQAAATGKPVYGRELTLAFEDGTERETLSTAVPLLDEAGNPRGAVGASIDVTEQKQAEKALRESELRFRTVYERSPVGISLVDSLTGQFLQVNPKFCEITGRSEEELLKSNVRSITHPDDVGLDLANLQQLAEEKLASYEMEKRYLRPDGSVRWVRLLVTPMWSKGDTRRWEMGLMEDITEQKRAEKALRESEQRFRAVYERSPVGIILVDSSSGRFVQVNPSFCEIAGRSEQELLGSEVLSITHPDDVESCREYLEQLAEGKAKNCEIEKRYVRPDRSTRWVRIHAVPMQGRGETLRCQIGLVQDITERRRAEQDLRASEERLRLALEVTKIGTFERNLQTGESNWSRETEAMYGLAPGEFPKSIAAFLELVHGEDRPYVVRLVEQSMRIGDVEGEWRVVWPDGTVHWIAGRWRILKDEHGRPLRALGMDFDITARKQVEEAIATLVQQVRADSSENFFTSMAIQLARCLEADYTIIGQLIKGDEGKLRTIGVCGQGAIADNFTRNLADTPCGTVVEQGTCSYVAGVTERFPRDFLLKQMKVEGYAGTSLRDSQGRVIGIMVALYTRPLVNAKFAETILQLFSARTAANIERMRTEEALRQSEERFRVALKHSPISVFNQDRDLRYTWMYNAQVPGPSGHVGKTPVEFFGAEEGWHITEVRRRVLETGVGARHEVQLTVAGKKHYFDTTIEPVLDSAGAVIGLTGASMDVTELREASEALREAKKKLTEEKFYLEQEIDTELGFGEIIGKSKALQTVMENVGKVAASDATVLLLGETGTGKELVARAIHRLSQRANNSFIKLNCAAIPSGLLESELFGNEKGAFTGAVSRKIGRLELADKGTLFLDEIGEISLVLQPKLLRVLQDHEFERLGGTQTLQVDFRLIAATNRDLADRVRENEFRSDLYYRLNVFPIRVPPLRERREDIQLLVEHFVQKFAQRMKKSITSIPTKTVNALKAWEWPGNIRELENFIERSVILTQGSVLVSPIGELQSMRAEEEALDESLEAAEREHILRALRESHGQIGGLKGAAMRLGLKRTTLQSKLKQLGINPRSGPTQP